MRRVLIVSIAIAALFASSAVMAGEQQVVDRLLEILKERQNISEEEFAELSDLAEQMKDDRSEVDQQLSALDASISEYLAMEGDDDEAGVAVMHEKGNGFGFASGNFELWVGGLFQFEYYGLDVDEGRNTNNFRVKEARFDFTGKAFVEGFTYRFEFEADGGVTMLDGYGNYVVAEGVQVRFGQFKTPYGRQQLTYAGNLGFLSRSMVSEEFAPGRDVGVMGHDVVALGEGDDMALEWAFALVNGDGTNVQGNDNNWFGWVARVGFYPMGHVEYSEGDLENTQDLKFGVAAAFASYRNRPAGETVQTDSFEFDFVVLWSGLYATAEFHTRSVDTDATPATGEFDDKGWFLQAGFQIPDSEFEVLGRYSMIDWDGDRDVDETSSWELGVAWYPGQEGHPFKAVVSFGQVKADFASGVNPPASSPTQSDLASLATEYGDTFFLRIVLQLDW